METSNFVGSLDLDQQRFRDAQLQRLRVAQRYLVLFARTQAARPTVVSEEIKEAIGRVAEVLRDGRVW